MKKFQNVKSIITPLNLINVDTDQIVPKQFLKRVQKTGFGKSLFYNWRFDSEAKPIPSFVLNNKKYQNSKILIAKDNFGCGSSREHAIWALLDFGFSVIIAPSFADIFYNNCFQNGLLAIRLNSEIVDKLMKINSEIEIDLENQIIKTEDGPFYFEIERYRKKNLLEGLDPIGVTMKYHDRISEYEEKTFIQSF